MGVITISRGTLGAATKMSGRLAVVLGCPLVSREEVYEAAKAYGIQETGLGEMSFVDQRPPSFWHPFSDRRRRYLACFQAALMDLALSGDLIYVGHLAHLLLAGYRRMLRVRLAAPNGYRVDTLVRERGLTEALALSYVREVDERRLRWSQFLYGVDWRDPDLYDLVLNPEKLRLETMCDAVAAIARSPEMQPTAKDQQQLRDLRLAAVARATLLRNGLDLPLEADSATGRLRVHGASPSIYVANDVWERDVRKILADVPGVAMVEVVPGEPAET